MTLRCSLWSHPAAPVQFENQGFVFSRCQRCGDDLIRSATTPEIQWRSVPPGFRVAWRLADTTAFEYRSDAEHILQAAARSVATMRGVARMAAAMSGWWIADAARRVRLKLANAGRSSRRMLRLPGWPRPGRRLVVTFQVTMLKDQPQG